MKVNPHRHCLNCWYVLDGLTSSRCPECGRGFDATDPSSFSTLPRRAYHFQRMLPILGLTLLFLLIELLCIKFVWNTAGQSASTFWAMLVVAGNVIVFASLFFRRRRLSAALLAALVLLTCPSPVWLQIKLHFLESEARHIIAYAEGVRQQTGRYPPDLSTYPFRHPWTSSSFAYYPMGFQLHWWAHQRGVSHWYTPAGGFRFYPD